MAVLCDGVFVPVLTPLPFLSPLAPWNPPATPYGAALPPFTRGARGRIFSEGFAVRLGVRLRTYQYYESDTEQSHRPDLETLAALADLYEVSVDYLIGRTDAR